MRFRDLSNHARVLYLYPFAKLLYRYSNFPESLWGTGSGKRIPGSCTALSMACPCLVNKEKAVEYIERCKNYDGGFGSSVGAESHAVQGGNGSFHAIS